jgi:Ca-activated chloride channel family protein
MTRVFATTVIAALALAVADAQQVFRSSIDLVNLGIVVTGRNGVPVLGLTREDFEVIEDGVPQRVTHFAGGDPESAPPVHLAFMIDHSGSMVKDIRDVRTAAIKFLNQVDGILDVTLIDFDTEVRLARFNPDDFPRMIERIRGRRPDGYTALYDAISVYLDAAAAQTGDKILVLYTDGGDTRSTMTQGDLLNLLKLSDVTVYSIGYLQHQGSGRHEQMQVLSRIGSTSGGLAFFPTSTNDLDKMYEQILSQIAGRYSVGYVSTNTATDGKWREVRVRLANKPALKDLRIRTRAGYFAPYKPASQK